MTMDSEQRPALAGSKRLRNALGLSQLQLAEVLGIDPKCISRYETEDLVPRGRLRLALQMLAELARVYGLDPPQLVMDTAIEAAVRLTKKS